MNALSEIRPRSHRVDYTDESGEFLVREWSRVVVPAFIEEASAGTTLAGIRCCGGGRDRKLVVDVIRAARLAECGGMRDAGRSSVVTEFPFACSGNRLLMAGGLVTLDGRTPGMRRLAAVVAGEFERARMVL